MSGNIFGSVFRVSTFGESHGAALGCIIDGCPSGLSVDEARIQAALDRRRPGARDSSGNSNPAATSRNEPDRVEVLSGIKDGITEGTPVALVIRNTSQHSADYSNLAETFRPGHADFTYDAKYGFRDYRGGGRSSGRETAARVAAGAVASVLLEKYGIKATAYTVRAAGVDCGERDFSQIDMNMMRAPSASAAGLMLAAVEKLRLEGDSAGGIVECTVSGVPAGLGEPVFDKLDAELAKAVMSVGAVKGIEFGDGFASADSRGSQNNDCMRAEGGNPVFLSNHSGGILGGISNGNTIVFRAAVKPVPSIFKSQRTVRRTGGEYLDADLEIKGRHDVCLCPRIVPVIEAMANLVLADMLLRSRCARA